MGTKAGLIELIVSMAVIANANRTVAIASDRTLAVYAGSKNQTVIWITSRWLRQCHIGVHPGCNCSVEQVCGTKPVEGEHT